MEIYMELIDFIKSGLVVLVPALYFIGVMLKASPVSDWFIPFLLGGIGIGLSLLWHIGLYGFSPSILFDSIVQGVLCAAGSVYIKNLSVQYQKRNNIDSQ